LWKTDGTDAGTVLLRSGAQGFTTTAIRSPCPADTHTPPTASAGCGAATARRPGPSGSKRGAPLKPSSRKWRTSRASCTTCAPATRRAIPWVRCGSATRPTPRASSTTHRASASRTPAS
jgi:hypothetical protein